MPCAVHRKSPGSDTWSCGIIRAQPSFEPSPEQPLVYHLFGHFSDLRNSVLTEDDYFDFLIHFWKEKEAIPSMVRAALINTSLLFLGFRMHHWDFRVLFRSLLAQEGAKRRAKHTHVAVQIDLMMTRLSTPSGRGTTWRTTFRILPTQTSTSTGDLPRIF